MKRPVLPARIGLVHVLACTAALGHAVACGSSDTAPSIDAPTPAPDAPPPVADAAGPPVVDAAPSDPDAGPSGASCGGLADPVCPAGEFCDWTPDTCGFDDSTGTCATIPTGGCPRIYAPVCGCDGVTYGNLCEAHAAGVDILYEGMCATMQCGGFAGLVCDPGYFCDWTPDTCGVSDQIGDCREIPMFCPDVFDPVCGCDGITYGNQCEAAAAGMDIIYTGPCT